MLSPETLKELADILHDDLGREYNPTEIFEIAHSIAGLFDRFMEFDFEDNNDNENEWLLFRRLADWDPRHKETFGTVNYG